MTKGSGRLIAAAAFACIAGTIWWRIDEYQDLSFGAVMSLMMLALLSAGAAIVLVIAGSVGARSRMIRPGEPANRGAELRAAMKDAWARLEAERGAVAATQEGSPA